MGKLGKWAGAAAILVLTNCANRNTVAGPVMGKMICTCPQEQTCSFEIFKEKDGILEPIGAGIGALVGSAL